MQALKSPIPKLGIKLPPISFKGAALAALFRLCWLIAIPVTIFDFIKRNDGLRRYLLITALAIGGIYWKWGDPGLAIVLQMLGFALNLVYAIGFMVIQFGSLFWFMGRTRTTEIRPGDPKTITWDDYWGNKHLVDHVRHWNKLLVDRYEFAKMGGRTLNGLLMDGPPGTGKTMMAKALAGSGGVAFLGIEGSSFRGMFWGTDTLKVMGFVRKGKKLAKIYGACILFIDEIDAVGASRGGVQGDGRQRQLGAYGGMMGTMGSGALTRLLYEMDGILHIPGFDMAQNRVRKLFGLPLIDQGRIMFMGSTNRPDVLDPALLRPGRFDQHIHIGMPDEIGRKEIIEGYLGTITHDDEVSIDDLVADTPMATPAHIMSVITKDAPRMALFKGRNLVTQDDLELAFQEKLIGIANPIGNWDERQKKAVAAHESGHAIAMRAYRPDKRLVRVSIIRRGRALGYALDVNMVDVYAHPQSEWAADIMVSLAGDIGAKIIMGEEWTGMGGDLLSMQAIVYNLILYGRFGRFYFSRTGDPLSDKDIDEMANRYIANAMDQVERMLRKKLPVLEALTDALFEREDMNGAEAIEIMEAAAED